MKNNTSDSAQKIDLTQKSESFMKSLNDFEKENETTNTFDAVKFGNIAEVATKNESSDIKSNLDSIQNVKMSKFEDKNILNNSEKRVVQSSEQNAEFARRRREKELNERIEQAKVSAVIEALDGINPLTNESMKNKEDVQKFLEMKSNQLKNNFVDSTKVNCLLDKEKSANIDEKTTKNNEKSTNNDENIENKAIKSALSQNNDNISELNQALEYAEMQKREFLLKHNEEEYFKLMKDEHFLSFISDKSHMSLENMQKEYQNFVNKIELSAKIMASQILANKLSSPGALRSDVSVEPNYLSREQVEEMSRKEIHDNYDKIKQSMKHWK